MRRKCDRSSGRPSSRSGGVPRGSSSPSVIRPLSCVSATGRAAQSASSSDLSAYSCSSRSTLPGDVSSAATSRIGARPLPEPPVKSNVSFPQRRKYVAREFLHEGLPPGGLLSYFLIRLRLLWP